MKKYIVPFFLISVLFFSCQKVVEVPLNNSEPRLIIEGLITDKVGPYYIKLTTTGDFYSNNPPPSVIGTTVVIKDDLGNEDHLIEVEGKPGIYQTTTLQGEAGRTYYLSVVYNGKIYEATAYMPNPILIKLNGIAYNSGEVFLREGYYASFNLKFTDQSDETFYYRLYVYRNDTLYNRSNPIQIRNTTLIKGNEIKNWMLNSSFELKDTLQLTFYTLTKQSYDYYDQFRDLIDSDGGLFSPPPANPPSNISNQGLGIFHASAITKIGVIIEE